jgi:hypothetical protein
MTQHTRVPSYDVMVSLWVKRTSHIFLRRSHSASMAASWVLRSFMWD